ncbi:hypothetical protein [Aquisphaera insulae]|uniref:hypothetical protein n=1 Tax=Aquisphaera insulae TaxID=2712864 RepID=UPI0013EAB106|nr:hypothetical protein [Aquisphaera insulae]
MTRGATEEEKARPPRPTNRILVSPRGPRDGGDFGPFTPGTRTSGLQEAFEEAKRRGMDLEIAGGNWTEGKTSAVVYNLDETLRVPWMQNARVDGGHAVLNYTKRTGDAVVFDSQMSGSYRFGLIVSASDGAVVRMAPTTAGPDGFRVITSCEFVFNALVGGGGAWPGGSPHQNELDRSRRWTGTGLHLDGSKGSIDANKITVVETVGCGAGLRLSEAVSRNTIEEVNIHLCEDHIRIGGPDDRAPADNRISAFLDCQGIETATGASVFGPRNMLTLSTRPFPRGADLTFGESAAGNVAILQSACRVVDRSPAGSNHLLGVPPTRPR